MSSSHIIHCSKSTSQLWKERKYKPAENLNQIFNINIPDIILLGFLPKINEIK